MGNCVCVSKTDEDSEPGAIILPKQKRFETSGPAQCPQSPQTQIPPSPERVSVCCQTSDFPCDSACLLDGPLSASMVSIQRRGRCPSRLSSSKLSSAFSGSECDCSSCCECHQCDCDCESCTEYTRRGGESGFESSYCGHSRTLDSKHTTLCGGSQLSAAPSCRLACGRHNSTCLHTPASHSRLPVASNCTSSSENPSARETFTFTATSASTPQHQHQHAHAHQYAHSPTVRRRALHPVQLAPAQAHLLGRAWSSLDEAQWARAASAGGGAIRWDREQRYLRAYLGDPAACKSVPSAMPSHVLGPAAGSRSGSLDSQDHPAASERSASPPPSTDCCTESRSSATEESLRSSESSIATQNQLDALSQLQLAAASATHGALDA